MEKPSVHLDSDLRIVLGLTAFLLPLSGALIGSLLLLGLLTWDIVRRRRARVSFGPLRVPLLLFLVMAGLAGLASEQRTIAVGSAVLAVLGVVLIYGHTYWALQHHPDFADTLLRALGIGTILAAIVGVGVLLFGSAERATVPRMHPNAFGFGLMVSALLAFGTWSRRPTWICTLAALTTVGVLASFSRAAILGWGAGLLALIILMPPPRRVLVGSLAAVVLGASVALTSAPILGRTSEFLHRPTGTIPATWRSAVGFVFSVEGNRDRILIWKEALAVIRDHPLFGVGLGAYASIVGRYEPPSTVQLTGPNPHPHNVFLNMAAEVGIIGLIIFLWIVAAGIRRGLATLHEAPEIKGATLAATVGMLVSEHRDSILMTFHMSTALWLVLALLCYHAASHSASTQ